MEEEGKTLEAVGRMIDYQQVAYLIACHEIVADLEINAIELDVLGKYLDMDENPELSGQRKLIFSNDEHKPSLSSLINDLSLIRLTQEQKEEIIRLLTEVAYADGYLAEQEEKIIEKVGNAIQLNLGKFFNEAKTKSQGERENERLKWHENARGIFDTALYNLSLNKSKNFVLNRVFKGSAFTRVLEKVTKEAEMDLNRVSRLIGEVNDGLKKELEKLSALPQNQGEDKTVEEVKEMLAITKGHIKEIVEISLSDNILSLEKKKRNMRFFTIAFMGRTKAGKSTFHKAITLQENDDIGIGGLRTTRYNRSWYWDRLRIIDTPGIGAPGGETDTDIAESIIDEADMVCYLVTDDSIQETEFDFLETIKERNKPLYIIINVKSNLSESIRLKKFLNDPSAWRTATGQQSLEGHRNRINSMLAGKYNMDAVKVIPLHLLAAIKSLDEGYSEDVRNQLHDGSNIDEFILAVKKEIYDSGTLKKSMSIIDGSAYRIHTIHNVLSNDYDELRYSLDNLKKSLVSLEKFTNDETDKLQQDLLGILGTAQEKLKNRASGFANDNYDNRSADSAWGKDSVVKSIGENTNELIEMRFSDFKDKLTARIEEIVADLKILSSLKIDTSYHIHGKKVINTKLGVGIMGSIITAISPVIISQIWNPVGWVLAGVSAAILAVTALITSVVRSKSKKIKRAQDKMRESLNTAIDESFGKNKDEIKNKVEEIKQNILSQLESSIGEYVNQTEETLGRMHMLLERSVSTESSINSLVGLRILDYIRRPALKDKKIDELSDRELRKTFPVDRDWEKQSLRYIYRTNCSEKDRVKAEKATQMNIIFS